MKSWVYAWNSSEIGLSNFIFQQSKKRSFCLYLQLHESQNFLLSVISSAYVSKKHACFDGTSWIEYNTHRYLQHLYKQRIKQKWSKIVRELYKRWNLCDSLCTDQIILKLCHLYELLYMKTTMGFAKYYTKAKGLY